MDYRIGVNKLLSNTFFIAIVLVLFRGQTKLIYITNELLLVLMLIFGICFFQNKVHLRNFIWKKEIILFFLWGLLSYVWSTYGKAEKGYYFVFVALIVLLMSSMESEFWNKLIRCTILFSNIIAISIFIEAVSPGIFIKLVGWILAFPANALASARMGEYTGILGGNQQAAVFLNIGIAAHIANCYANREIDKKSISYIVIYLIAIVFTNKRMLTIIPIILLLLYYFMSGTKNKYTKFLGVAFVFFVIGYVGLSLSPEFSTKILGYFSGEDGTDMLSGRGAFWLGCLQMFLERPVNGYGLASFNGEYFARTHYLFNGNPWIYHAHNIYYQILAELGSVGLGLFILQALKIIPKIYTLNRKKETMEKEQRQILFWSMCIVIIFLVYGLTGNVLYNTEEIGWYVIGINGISYTVSSSKCKKRHK